MFEQYVYECVRVCMYARLCIYGYSIYNSHFNMIMRVDGCRLCVYNRNATKGYRILLNGDISCGEISFMTI